jgi:hypothetical protein
MLKKIILLAALITFAGFASAILADLPESSGLYMDLNGGAGYINNSGGNVIKNIFGQGSEDTRAVAVGIFDLGYKFTDYVSAEVGFSLYGNKTQYGEVYKQNYTLDIALKGTFPILEGFDAFGKIGAAVVHTQQSYEYNDADVYDKTAFAPLLAMGLDYYFTPNLSLILQGGGTFEGNSSDGETVYPNLALTIGIGYLFNMD